MLYPDETASLTNIDGYFNCRFRSQKGPLKDYIRHEMDTIVKLSKGKKYFIKNKLFNG